MNAMEGRGARISADGLMRLGALAEAARLRRRGAPLGPPGGSPARRRGRGLEIHDVRLFQEGDDARHIDPAVSARMGAPHVRRFHDERDQALVLLADLGPAMQWGARRALRAVAGLEALALCGWGAIAEGGRLGLIAFGHGDLEALRPRGRLAGAAAAMGAMARAQDRALAFAAQGGREAGAFGRALESALRLIPSGGRVLAASAFDGLSAADEAALAALAARAPCGALIIADSFAPQAPPGEYLMTDELGQTRRLVLGAGRGGADGAARKARLEGLGLRAFVIDAGAPPETWAFDLALWEGTAHG